MSRYCVNCGYEMPPDSKFCSSCGFAVSGQERFVSARRREIYDSAVYKCPSCGEVLGTFVGFCPSCGYELRGVQSSRTIADFVAHLQDDALERQAARINSFVIPNSKEDLFETMLLVRARMHDLVEREDEINEQLYLDLLHAWRTKALEAIHKAELLLSDEDVGRLRRQYEHVDSLYRKRGERRAAKRALLFLRENSDMAASFVLFGVAFLLAAAPYSSVGGQTQLFSQIIGGILLLRSVFRKRRAGSMSGLMGILLGMLVVVIASRLNLRGGDASFMGLCGLLCMVTAPFLAFGVKRKKTAAARDAVKRENPASSDSLY